ncbi:MAG: 2-dehydro-3-deoxy-D-gluconate 5-dehydrogenase KduD [Lewinellaceae bacterium]|nr:2-dehydro-3-deoxy-D-gluconate 5-dehydrogenase KduD [Lewinellaceae bacterium]
MNPLFSLNNKNALITGASRGLGQAMAIALAKAGAFVVCCSSAPGGTDETLRLIEAKGGQAMSLFADLSDREAVRKMYQEAREKCGRIDILVNNGGTIARYPASEFPLDEWDRVLEVNLTSAFYLSQLAGRDMIENGGGKIINTASMLSYSGGITVPAYTASKHGIAGITRALANEWAQYNIQVNAIAPGYFRTDNTQRLQDDPVRNAEISKRIPAGRWGDPEDLAGVVIFLASQASDYVNGAIINVDGGWMAR